MRRRSRRGSSSTWPISPSLPASCCCGVSRKRDWRCADRRGRPMQTADVVIVGSGIVGSATAYFLSAEPAFQGRRAVLVERDPSYAQGSTARSAGGLRQQFSTPENIALSQFTLALFRRLEAEFDRHADVGFREQGYLIMASAGSRPVLAENVALQESMGADIELVEGADLTRRFVWLSADGVAAAGYGRSGEGWFDPPSLAALFRDAAKRRGISIVNDAVTAVEVRGRIEAVRLT